MKRELLRVQSNSLNLKKGRRKVSNKNESHRQLLLILNLRTKDMFHDNLLINGLIEIEIYLLRFGRKE